MILLANQSYIKSETQIQWIQMFWTQHTQHFLFGFSLTLILCVLQIGRWGMAADRWTGGRILPTDWSGKL